MICGELDADTKATINTVNHSLLSGYKTTQRDREREGQTSKKQRESMCDLQHESEYKRGGRRAGIWWLNYLMWR